MSSSSETGRSAPVNTDGCIGTRYDDVWLVGGVRTPFTEYNGVLREVSPTDLGILAARGALAATGVDPGEVNLVVATSLAQAAFDAYYLPRHIGLYAGIPQPVPAIHVHRLCGSGFETLTYAADAITLGKAEAVLCVGAESMSRNPVAAYVHRWGFRLGQVEFGDFLWESLRDTAPDIAMGHTAENLARRYGITRAECDAFAERSFALALEAQESGFHAGEVVPVETTEFTLDGYRSRGIRLPRKAGRIERDDHVRPTTADTLAKLPPVFGGVQTAGNSSGIVDGAAACIVASGAWLRSRGIRPLARIVATTAVGVPPEIMGIGPAPAIHGVAELAGIDIAAIERFEINEAFAAQYLAVERELGLERSRVNVHGGAIAIGHPLAATGLRCTLTLARELANAGLTLGVSSACCGGGQGVAVLLERTEGP